MIIISASYSSGLLNKDPWSPLGNPVGKADFLLVTDSLIELNESGDGGMLISNGKPSSEDTIQVNPGSGERPCRLSA